MAIAFKLSAARQGDWWQGLTSCTAYSAQKPSLQTDADLPTPSQRSSIQGFYHARESHHNPKAVAHGRPRGSKSPSPSGTKNGPPIDPRNWTPMRFHQLLVEPPGGPDIGPFLGPDFGTAHFTLAWSLPLPVAHGRPRDSGTH